ncbi:MAG: aldo/keto reductase [Christensenellaceae bacterium]|jgi:predicted aldo/keto reductase-like oxidoreductase
MGNYLGEHIKKLGFGLMRMPETADGKTDLAQVKDMVDAFMQAGFSYFDTAYVYGDGESEEVAKAAVVDRYPRDTFELATKLPLREITSEESLDTLFNTSLSRTGAGYFDYYLLHAIDSSILDALDKYNVWAYGQTLKQKGLIKHFGFSFHDSAEVLDEILTAHPEVDFVQLQINYIDWESDSVQSRLCYEVARKHEKPIVIMEPIKGGSLALLAEDMQKIFKDTRPELSIASWGMRFAASLDGIITVLSGMSDMAQMEDNISYMKDFEPLTDLDRDAILQVVEKLNKIDTIPCTDCKYCVPNCPQNINIPSMIKALNNYRLYNTYEKEKERYDGAIEKGGRASECIECGVCEGYCPQHIAIIEVLKDVAGVFEN